MSTGKDDATPLWITCAPGLFVVLWASGFPISRLGLAYAEPFTLLTMRSVLNVAFMLALLPFFKFRWPKTWRETGHIAVAGFLLQSAYLGCIFVSIGEGVSQGAVALIAGMQPILTAILVGHLLGERIVKLQWIGFLLGFGGLALVMIERATFGTGTTLGYCVAAATPVLITSASLYQKRFCAGMDLRSAMVIQHSTVFVTNGIFALLLETRQIVASFELGFALLWLVLLLSMSANNLYFVMLRRGEAGRVSSLFYLTPPTAVLMAYLTYGESFGITALVGFAVAAIGVALVTRAGAGAR
jgi:drug/metabolite transporter (DMT)-like permease